MWDLLEELSDTPEAAAKFGGSLEGARQKSGRVGLVGVPLWPVFVWHHNGSFTSTKKTIRGASFFTTHGYGWQWVPDTR